MKRTTARRIALLLALLALLLCAAFCLASCGLIGDDTPPVSDGDDPGTPSQGTEDKTPDDQPDPLAQSKEGDGGFGGSGNPTGNGEINPSTVTPIDPFR